MGDNLSSGIGFPLFLAIALLNLFSNSVQTKLPIKISTNIDKYGNSATPRVNPYSPIKIKGIAVKNKYNNLDKKHYKC